MDDTEQPLTPTLSPSEGAREALRQFWVWCRLRTPLQLCTRLLHNYGLGPGLSKGPHVLEVTRGETLLAGELVLEIPGETVNDFSAPPLRLLAIEDQPSDVPIQREQFTIGGQTGADLGGAHPALDVGEQLSVAA